MLWVGSGLPGNPVQATGVCGREDVGRAMGAYFRGRLARNRDWDIGAGDDNFPASEAKTTRVRKPATIDLPG